MYKRQALCSAEYLLGEGIQEESTDSTRVLLRGVVFVYMIGTMLGRYTIGEKFMPPHVLKKSADGLFGGFAFARLARCGGNEKNT